MPPFCLLLWLCPYSCTASSTTILVPPFCVYSCGFVPTAAYLLVIPFWLHPFASTLVAVPIAAQLLVLPFWCHPSVYSCGCPYSCTASSTTILVPPFCLLLWLCPYSCISSSNTILASSFCVYSCDSVPTAAQLLVLPFWCHPSVYSCGSVPIAAHLLVLPFWCHPSVYSCDSVPTAAQLLVIPFWCQPFCVYSCGSVPIVALFLVLPFWCHPSVATLVALSR